MNIDRNSGVIPKDKETLIRAKNADLITLPPDISGTRCNNCMYFRPAHSKTIGWCEHNDVKQDVSNRQCCALWDSSGVIRPWLKKKS